MLNGVSQSHQPRDNVVLDMDALKDRAEGDALRQRQPAGDPPANAMSQRFRLLSVRQRNSNATPRNIRRSASRSSGCRSAGISTA